MSDSIQPGQTTLTDHDDELSNSVGANGHDHADGIFPDEIGLDEIRDAASHRVHAYREAGFKFLGFYDQVLAFIIAYENPRLAAWCIAIATGRRLLTGGCSQKDLADKLGCTKANIVKCTKAIQARFGNSIAGIEPMPGQRSLASCKTFAQVRNGQLNNHHE
jgi:hypothetical protein